MRPFVPPVLRFSWSLRPWEGPPETPATEYVIQLLGQLQQRELAPCYFVLRGHVLLLVRVRM